MQAGEVFRAFAIKRIYARVAALKRELAHARAEDRPQLLVHLRDAEACLGALRQEPVSCLDRPVARLVCLDGEPLEPTQAMRR